MAPRRTAKFTKLTNIAEYSSLTLKDVLCPVCRTILIEPVSLPCNHGFCYNCFQGTLENANLTCPLCRVRFGSWHRTAKKDDKVVNRELWSFIRTSFPKHVQSKLDTSNENTIQVQDVPDVTVTNKFKTQPVNNLSNMRHIHSKKESGTVQRIGEQELEVYEHTVREEKLRYEEQVAQKLASDIQATTSKTTPKKRPVETFKTSKYLNRKRSVHKKEIKTSLTLFDSIIDNKILEQHTALTNLTTVNEITDSNDSIDKECRYFKPIEIRNIPPANPVPIVKVPAILKKKNTIELNSSPIGINNLSHNCESSAFAALKISVLSEPVVKAPNPLSLKRQFTETAQIEPETNSKPQVKKPSKIQPITKPTVTVHSTNKSNQSNSPVKRTPITRTRSKDFLMSSTTAVTAIPKVNGIVNSNLVKPDHQQPPVNHVLRKVQEKEDYQLAKNLHMLLNRVTRSNGSIVGAIKKRPLVTRKRRQVVLDKLLPASVK